MGTLSYTDTKGCFLQKTNLEVKLLEGCKSHTGHHGHEGQVHEGREDLLQEDGAEVVRRPIFCFSMEICFGSQHEPPRPNDR